MNKIMTLLLPIICLSFVTGPPKKDSFTLKKFEKKISLIKSGLYAGKYEVSNLEYNEFLNYLEKQGDKELIEKARIHNENWQMDGGDLQPMIDHYHLHPAYYNYPVVNVSYEGAVAFCKWLTETYNAYPKRVYKKVIFRLPTEQEWMEAAKGRIANAIFPWGGPYVRNNKGEFLANFKVVNQALCKNMSPDQKSVELAEKDSYNLDGIQYHFTAPVDGFSPNGIGLHHCSGNVAEMLAEPGSTKGGSWASYGYYIRIDAKDEFAGFTKPSPKIGFRYFMEVIEE